MLFLTLGRPRRIRVGDVVEPAQWPRFEWSGGPHARERPAIEARRRRDLDLRGLWQADQILATDERFELLELRLRGRDHVAGRRMIPFRARPRGEGILAIQPGGRA